MSDAGPVAIELGCEADLQWIRIVDDGTHDAGHADAESPLGPDVDLTSQPGAGSGLELPIVEDIARAIDCEVRSTRRPGRGTRSS